MAGSDVTFSGSWTQIGKAIKFADEHEDYGSSNTPNLLTMYDDLVTSLDGEFTPALAGIVKQRFLNPVAQALSPQVLRELFRPGLLEILRATGNHTLTADAQVVDAEALRQIRQYMVDNDQWILSSGPTFDTSASGSTTGTGAVYRLTTDKDGMPLECTGAESKALACVLDQNNPGGAKHAEVFEFRFSDADPTGLQWIGTGGTKRLASLNAKSANLLVNPSFEQGAVSNNTALSTTGQLTGWDVTTASNLKTYSAAAYVYRGYQNDTGVTHYGVEFVASDTLIQVVKTENPGASFDERTPYRCQVAWQRKSSATGTLTLHLGAVSKSVDVSTGTNDQWNILAIDLDEDAWFANFNENALDVKIDMATLATGTVVVDDVVLAPMTNLDGTWWCVVGGATPWKNGDTLTFASDARGTATVLNYWLWRAYGFDTPLLLEMRGWIPATANATEVTAAGGRTLTYASSGNTITASSGSFVSDGYKVGMLATSAGTSSNNFTAPITAVSATVLTFASGVSDEGPLSSTATLNATPSILDPT